MPEKHGNRCMTTLHSVDSVLDKRTCYLSIIFFKTVCYSDITGSINLQAGALDTLET